MVEALKKIGEHQLLLAVVLVGCATALAWVDKLSPDWLAVAYIIGALLGAQRMKSSTPD